jgi:small subunit ribosomal protein S3
MPAAKKAVAKKAPAKRATAKKAAPVRTAPATEARAFQRGTRQSPYKMRLVIDQIRGKDVNEALALLTVLEEACGEADLEDAEERRRECRAGGAGDELGARRGFAVHQARDHQRGAEAQAVHAGRSGTCDSDSEADQPRGNRGFRKDRALMGQKTNPIGFRLGISKQWNSRYYAGRELPALLREDELLRKYLKARLGHAAIANIVIERKPGKVVVTLHTGRPGVVIGKKGAEVDKLRDELSHLTSKEVGINVEEIKRPELDAQLVADNIAAQLAQRISFRRAMKRAVQSTMRMGAAGIKVKAGGRLGGAEIARVEGYHEGRVPLHTLRADIDYAISTAKTTYGTIGVKGVDLQGRHRAGAQWRHVLFGPVRS